MRIDDPNYTDAWDSSVAINPDAQMPTFVGDGSTAAVEIGRYIQTSAGDVLIFRPIESDGSVTITDPNLLDTRLSGGTLSAIDQLYITATGKTAEEIAISGGKFTEPNHVPAPEENIPGQVLDSVSIRVFHSTVSGAASLQSKILRGNGLTQSYAVGQTVLENSSVLVYVDSIKKQIGIDYTINFEDHTVNFLISPPNNSTIEILSIGIGGLELLDYQEFIADGATNLFLTNANYNDTSSIFVTVNGIYEDIGFRNSTDVIDAVGKTLVEFGLKPNNGDIIKIICLKASSDVDSSGTAIVRLNKQIFEFEGSTRSFDLSGFVKLVRSSAVSSMIVEVNGRALQGVDTIYRTYDGTTNQYILGTDPAESSGTILPSNISVYINNELKTFIQDYLYDGTSKILTIKSNILSIGDTIKIENDFRSEYIVVNNNLIINSSVDLTSTNETDNDIVEVTWFTEYPSVDIVSDEFTGGKAQYQLANTPLSLSYVWVYKNGIRLTQEKDYYISLPRAVIYLTEKTEISDSIKIVLFGSNIFRLPSAFEIHKDMLNFYHYNRFSKGSVKLSKELNYYDTQIEVTNASSLTDPIQSRNIPGTVYINGERIEYMIKQGNILTQLRRGSFGTPIAELCEIDSDVVDVGANETIPYNETQDRIDFVSDGSTLLVGPLNFIPTKSSRNSWYRSSIPSTHGPCDQLELFAAGRRLRKDPISVYQEASGVTSPEADISIEAEFSVDGSSEFVRLSTPLPAGTRVTIIKRTGKTWYDRGETTASAGVTLLENNTSIANFIAQKSTSLPE
jgi:hypothetical protein